MNGLCARKKLLRQMSCELDAVIRLNERWHDMSRMSRYLITQQMTAGFLCSILSERCYLYKFGKMIYHHQNPSESALRLAYLLVIHLHYFIESSADYVFQWDLGDYLNSDKLYMQLPTFSQRCSNLAR